MTNSLHMSKYIIDIFLIYIGFFTRYTYRLTPKPLGTKYVDKKVNLKYVILKMTDWLLLLMLVLFFKIFPCLFSNQKPS